MSSVLDVLLVHHANEQVQRLIAFWTALLANPNLLVVHGGTRAAFDSIDYKNKLFVEDPRLRTRDHQRELQSMTGVLRQVDQWITEHRPEAEFIFMAEYDHLPLVHDLHERQIDWMSRENADVLAFHLRRVDDTSYAHYLHHAALPEFHKFLRDMTEREDPDVVLSILATGSFWKRAPFTAVAAANEPFPMYSEIYLPTYAHHLGFRIRGYGEQDRFVFAHGDRADEIETARRAGAWTLHPVKTFHPLQLQEIIQTTPAR